MPIIGKKEIEEQIWTVKLDPLACASLKGQINEYGDCVLKAKINPDDPDVLILTPPGYKSKKPGQQVQQQE